MCPTRKLKLGWLPQAIEPLTLPHLNPLIENKNYNTKPFHGFESNDGFGWLHTGGLCFKCPLNDATPWKTCLGTRNWSVAPFRGGKNHPKKLSSPHFTSKKKKRFSNDLLMRPDFHPKIFKISGKGNDDRRKIRSYPSCLKQSNQCRH